jgi:hypothetical protein
MRLPIINKLSSRVEVHTLFLQPTPWCARNCTGCYVKERDPSESIDYQIVTPLREQFALLELFTKGELAWANEITVAMDDLPTHRGQQNHMVGLFDRFMNLIHENKIWQLPLPSMHMTFHTVNTYLSYVDRTKNSANWFRESIKEEDSWETLAFPAHLLDMINFSHLSTNEITKKLLKEIRKETSINYNYLIPRNVNKNNIKKHIKHLTEIGKMVDHIYLVIYKDPIGRIRSSEDAARSQRNMANDRFYIEQMQKHLPSDIKNKINIDGCLKDVEKFNATSYGCSSNISRFQVWPDGSVTGCAYGDKSITKDIGLSTEGILRNLKESRKRYDFLDAPCHLVEDYKNSEDKLDSLRFHRMGQVTRDILKEIL